MASKRGLVALEDDKLEKYSLDNTWSLDVGRLDIIGSQPFIVNTIQKFNLELYKYSNEILSWIQSYNSTMSFFPSP